MANEAHRPLVRLPLNVTRAWTWNLICCPEPRQYCVLHVLHISLVRAEPVAVFLYSKMRKKGEALECSGGMLSGFLEDHKMSSWLCIMCAIKTLPLFSDNSASTLSCGVSAVRVFRMHAEQKEHACSFSLSSAFSGSVCWDGAPEVKLWWLGLCPWCWLTIKKCLTESTARLKSSVPGQTACCMTALCQSQSKFKTLTQSVFDLWAFFFFPTQGSVYLSTANTIHYMKTTFRFGSPLTFLKIKAAPMW